MPGQPGHGQVGRRVRRDFCLARQPFEPAAQRAQAAELAAQRHRATTGFTVSEQVALIAFEDWLGDLGGIGEAAFVAPGDEPADGGAPAAHCVSTVAGDEDGLEVGFHRGGERQGCQRISGFLAPSGAWPPSRFFKTFAPGEHRSVRSG